MARDKMELAPLARARELRARRAVLTPVRIVQPRQTLVGNCLQPPTSGHRKPPTGKRLQLPTAKLRQLPIGRPHPRPIGKLRQPRIGERHKAPAGPALLKEAPSAVPAAPQERANPAPADLAVSEAQVAAAEAAVVVEVGVAEAVVER